MNLSAEDIKHLAKLAGIALSSEEIEKMKQELSQILDHVKQLEEVATRGVVETSHVHGITNIMREDVTEESLSVDTLADNAPDFDSRGFRVPRIIS